MLSKMAAAGAAVGAGVAARRAVELGWTMVRGSEPPTAADVTNDSDTELRDLLLWAVVVVGAVAVARSVAAGVAVSLLSSKDDRDED